jgi:fermentation-respiration switch protein FrsA (DUF1100 family)
MLAVVTMAKGTEQAVMKKRHTVYLAAVGLALLCSGCASSMLYYPSRHVYGNPSERALRHEEVSFRSKDGTVLSGWFIPAVGVPKGTVIHFHGNAQNMTAHVSFVSWLPRENFNVFVFDYRGYGKSGGEPDRKGVYEDSCAALNYLRSREEVDSERILIFGQSLGGANALAALHGTGAKGVQAVAIDSTFYSYRLIARDKIKHIPVLRLLRWPLSFLVISNAKSPASTIDQLPPIPVMILHGTDDAVIPFRHGQKLFDKATHPKQLIAVPNGHHTDALVREDPIYRRALVDFFEKALETRSTE